MLPRELVHADPTPPLTETTIQLASCRFDINLSFIFTNIAPIGHITRDNVTSETFATNYWAYANRRSLRIFFSQAENLF